MEKSCCKPFCQDKPFIQVGDQIWCKKHRGEADLLTALRGGVVYLDQVEEKETP